MCGTGAVPPTEATWGYDCMVHRFAPWVDCAVHAADDSSNVAHFHCDFAKSWPPDDGVVVGRVAIGARGVLASDLFVPSYVHSFS